MVFMIWNFEIEVKKVKNENASVKYLELNKAEAEIQTMKDYYQYLHQNCTR